MSELPKNGKTSLFAEKDAHVLAAVQETLRGNSDAFQVIVRHLTPLLYSICSRMLGDRNDAEEAVQEIFLKVYRSLSSFRIGKRFLPWVYTIALNHLRTLYRKKKLKHRALELLKHQAIIQNQSYMNYPDPGEGLAMAEAEKAAFGSLQLLRPEYREVFVLRAIEDYSVRDVSEIMGIPENTVKTFYHRARQELAEIISVEK
ncbi:MAG: RNA polymerase sigma factor [Spirochaetaceae bacterium]|nr:MAG: RNA polymerase sigma factor [Spirochaetaceae bacterium]